MHLCLIDHYSGILLTQNIAIKNLDHLFILLHLTQNIAIKNLYHLFILLHLTQNIAIKNLDHLFIHLFSILTKPHLYETLDLQLFE